MSNKAALLEYAAQVQKPITFELERGYDEGGVSGTGKVLEGVVFSDGSVAVHWTTKLWSVTFYPDVETFYEIHTGGHPDNKTVLRFADGWEWRQSGKGKMVA